jgi:L-ascorbate 6-phosphate lactonase
VAESFRTELSEESIVRDVAYWPETFIREIENAPVHSAALLRALGGPSFLYRTPRTAIWIDPYFYGTPDDAVPDAYRAPAIPVKPDEVRLADVVISTHDHVDHCHEGTIVPILSNTEAICVAPASSARLMRSWGIAGDRIREVKPGDVITRNDVTISVHPSYDPGEPSAVTYTLAADGTRLFVAGDTSDGPGLAEIGKSSPPDYALLAFGRTWYMGEEEMLRAAAKLCPRTLLPFHWEFWRNHTGDIARFFELYYRDRPDFNVKILLIGDSLPLRAQEA